ncbi:NrfD/PsrC family molybdoenzyme membrane anchor subunit [Propioniciclava sinopodophylli]|uniref:NrfD/PsrC family molybdoenzyme membrane anchor subunit n=1 Tax=Propioniciclava sinopodophylli TaxID=1837344 RepID=UPI002492B134|nr:NrfD/PsrC family molybdoenzyme membrane anchor subunit [Propioniciclava sinopodophylli]
MTTSPFDADRPPEPPRDGRRRRRRAGRRGDPNATVPDAEFRSYYGRPIVKQAPWGHEIAYYLFLGGLAAGSGLVGAGAHLTGRPTLRRNARLGALASVGLGGVALIADLGRPERALNMMRTAKLTSPMSVGSWILAGFGAFAGAGAVLEVARPLLRDGVLGRVGRVADPLASAGSAFFAPPLAAYTAVLLSDTATPLWHESHRELPFIFVSSATAAGCGLALATTPPEETAPVRALAGLAAACELVGDRLLERRLGEEGQPLKEGHAHTWHRAARALTAVGGVAALVAGRSRMLSAASGAALLAGSYCTRMAIYEAGQASAADPIYTVRPQRRRANAKSAAGQGATQPGGEWPTGRARE